MEIKDFEQLALVEASKSPAKKRKVGAIIVDNNGFVLSTGFNHNSIDPLGPCEDENGYTLPEVVHAEVDAINKISGIQYIPSTLTMYITHPPCENCQKAINEADIDHVVVVNQFMKFDTDKLRYDLIPTSSTKALASVLTYGAKKYKPGNWRMVDDPNRYIAATLRHFEAYRSGEVLDIGTPEMPGSGMPHLWHVMTNIAFLIELGYTPEAINGTH